MYSATLTLRCHTHAHRPLTHRCFSPPLRVSFCLAHQQGAIQYITDVNVQANVTGIASVKARFASYLNALTGSSPFPVEVDTPYNTSMVLKVFNQYVTSCAVPLNGPGLVSATAAPAIITSTIAPVETVAPSNVTVGNSTVDTSSTGNICNVVNPSVTGSSVAVAVPYDPTAYVCVDGNFLCPTTAPLNCNGQCYTTAQFICGSDGTLSQVSSNIAV